MAGASMERLPVISVTMSMTASGACAIPPKSAIIPTITNGARESGTPGKTRYPNRIQPANEPAQEAEHDIVQQLRWGGKGEAAVYDEDGIPAGAGSEHTVTYDRGDQRRNDCLNFQVVFVEDFSGQYCPTQRGAEDGTNA